MPQQTIAIFTGKSFSATRTKYISADKITLDEREEYTQNYRPLISRLDNTLKQKAATNYLESGIEDNAVSELVISTKLYNSLGKTKAERDLAFKSAVREGVKKLFHELKLPVAHPYVFAIHKNTDNEHAHVLIARHSEDKDENIKTFPRRLPKEYFELNVNGSRLSNIFQEAMEKRILALAPKEIQIQNERDGAVPPTGDAGRTGGENLLIENLNVNEEILKRLIDSRSLRFTPEGNPVFVKRNLDTGDASGSITALVDEKKYIESGAENSEDEPAAFFFTGDIEKAKKFVLVDSPLEAIALENKLRYRNLSDVSFISLNGRTIEKDLTGFFEKRITEEAGAVRFIWARGNLSASEGKWKQKLWAFDNFESQLKNFSRKNGFGETVINRFAPTIKKSWVLEGKMETVAAQVENEYVKYLEGTIDKYYPTIKTTTSEGFGETRNDDVRQIPTREMETAVADGTRAFAIRQAQQQINLKDAEKNVEILNENRQAENKKTPARNYQRETDTLKEIPVELVFSRFGLTHTRRFGANTWLSGDGEHKINVLPGNRFADVAAGKAKRGDGYLTDLSRSNAINATIYMSGGRMSFVEALNWVRENFSADENALHTAGKTGARKVKIDQPVPLEIPIFDESNLERVRDYLETERGISSDAINAIEANETLRADARSNAVFVLRDFDGHETGFQWRSTSTNFRGNAGGTSKDLGWFFIGDPHTADEIVFSEAPIEALSYYDLNTEKDWRQTAVISISGASAGDALLGKIKELENLKQITIAFNSDEPGQKSARSLAFRLANEMPEIEIVNQIPKEENDWNDYLKQTRIHASESVVGNAEEAVFFEITNTPDEEDKFENLLAQEEISRQENLAFWEKAETESATATQAGNSFEPAEADENNNISADAAAAGNVEPDAETEIAFQIRLESNEIKNGLTHQKQEFLRDVFKGNLDELLAEHPRREQLENYREIFVDAALNLSASLGENPGVLATGTRAENSAKILYRFDAEQGIYLKRPEAILIEKTCQVLLPENPAALKDFWKAQKEIEFYGTGNQEFLSEGREGFGENLRETQPTEPITVRREIQKTVDAETNAEITAREIVFQKRIDEREGLLNKNGNFVGKNVQRAAIQFSDDGFIELKSLRDPVDGLWKVGYEISDEAFSVDKPLNFQTDGYDSREKAFDNAQQEAQANLTPFIGDNQAQPLIVQIRGAFDRIKSEPDAENHKLYKIESLAEPEQHTNVDAAPDDTAADEPNAAQSRLNLSAQEIKLWKSGSDDILTARFAIESKIVIESWFENEEGFSSETLARLHEVVEDGTPPVFAEHNLTAVGRGETRTAATLAAIENLQALVAEKNEEISKTEFQPVFDKAEFVLEKEKQSLTKAKNLDDRAARLAAEGVKNITGSVLGGFTVRLENDFAWHGKTTSEADAIRNAKEYFGEIEKRDGIINRAGEYLPETVTRLALNENEENAVYFSVVQDPFDKNWRGGYTAEVGGAHVVKRALYDAPAFSESDALLERLARGLSMEIEIAKMNAGIANQKVYDDLLGKIGEFQRTLLTEREVSNINENEIDTKGEQNDEQNEFIEPAKAAAFADENLRRLLSSQTTEEFRSGFAKSENVRAGEFTNRAEEVASDDYLWFISPTDSAESSPVFFSHSGQAGFLSLTDAETTRFAAGMDSGEIFAIERASLLDLRENLTLAQANLISRNAAEAVLVNDGFELKEIEAGHFYDALIADAAARNYNQLFSLLSATERLDAITKVNNLLTEKGFSGVIAQTGDVAAPIDYVVVFEPAAAERISAINQPLAEPAAQIESPGDVLDEDNSAPVQTQDAPPIEAREIDFNRQDAAESAPVNWFETKKGYEVNREEFYRPEVLAQAARTNSAETFYSLERLPEARAAAPGSYQLYETSRLKIADLAEPETAVLILEARRAELMEEIPQARTAKRETELENILEEDRALKEYAVEMRSMQERLPITLKNVNELSLSETCRSLGYDALKTYDAAQIWNSDNLLPLGDASHRNQVRAALEAGLPTYDEILEDYPEMSEIFKNLSKAEKTEIAEINENKPDISVQIAADEEENTEEVFYEISGGRVQQEELAAIADAAGDALDVKIYPGVVGGNSEAVETVLGSWEAGRDIEIEKIEDPRATAFWKSQDKDIWQLSPEEFIQEKQHAELLRYESAREQAEKELAELQAANGNQTLADELSAKIEGWNARLEQGFPYTGAEVEKFSRDYEAEVRRAINKGLVNSERRAELAEISPVFQTAVTRRERYENNQENRENENQFRAERSHSGEISAADTGADAVAAQIETSSGRVETNADDLLAGTASDAVSRIPARGNAVAEIEDANRASREDLSGITAERLSGNSGAGTGESEPFAAVVEAAESELIINADNKADAPVAEKLETLELMPDLEMRRFYDESENWQLRLTSGRIEKITVVRENAEFYAIAFADADEKLFNLKLEATPERIAKFRETRLKIGDALSVYGYVNTAIEAKRAAQTDADKSKTIPLNAVEMRWLPNQIEQPIERAATVSTNTLEAVYEDEIDYGGYVQDEAEETEIRPSGNRVELIETINMLKTKVWLPSEIVKNNVVEAVYSFNDSLSNTGRTAVIFTDLDTNDFDRIHSEALNQLGLEGEFSDNQIESQRENAGLYAEAVKLQQQLDERFAAGDLQNPFFAVAEIGSNVVEIHGRTLAGKPDGMPLYSFYETELRGYYQIGVGNSYPASQYEPEDFYFRETDDYIFDYENSILKLTELLSEEAQEQKSVAESNAEEIQNGSDFENSPKTEKAAVAPESAIPTAAGKTTADEIKAGSKLLPDSLLNKMAARQENESSRDNHVYAKLFHPMSSWTMFITEAEAVRDESGKLEDVHLYGYVHTDGIGDEWGTSSLREIESVVVRGLKTEREKYFTEGRFADVYKQFADERGLIVPDEFRDAPSAAAVVEDAAAEHEAHEEIAPAENLLPENFRIENLDIHAGGLKTKFKMNVAAVELLNALVEEERQATPEEMEVLARFNGWGGMKAAFAGSNGWEKEHQVLRSIFSTEEQWREAQLSTDNAHFTSPEVAQAMWGMVEQLGFTGGRVLEPAVGIGNFLGVMPDALRENSALTFVEKEEFTAQLAAQLYPRATGFVGEGFEAVEFRDNYFDLVISNFPFHHVGPADARYKALNPNLHNYFFLKSLDKTREGGLVVALTSRYTLDSTTDDNIREAIHERADLIAAFRLPETAFQANANTTVVTDLLIFQKRAAAELPGENPNWIITDYKEIPAKDGDGTIRVPINEYFTNHFPERVLGEIKAGSMYIGNNLTVTPFVDEKEKSTAAVLREASDAALAPVYTPRIAETGVGFAEEAPEMLAQTQAIGTLFIENGELYRINTAAEAEKEVVTQRDFDSISAMLGLRDTLRSVYKAELAGSDAAEQETLRARLNTDYDEFAGKYGALKSKQNRKALGDEPDRYLLHSLEAEYDERTGEVEKAEVFQRPTLSGYQKPENAETLAQSIAISLNETGNLSINRIQELLGADSAEQIHDQLRAAGVAFENPESGVWEMRDLYLSGNVREKLNAATEAAKISQNSEKRFARNVHALEEVQPRDLDYMEIGVSLGASWIPPSDVKEFLGHLMKTGSDNFAVEFAVTTGQWQVSWARGAQWMRTNDNATKIWGTEDANVIKQAQHALDGKPFNITRKEEDKKGKTIFVTDWEATDAANQKLAQVKQEFKDWIWTDPIRRTRLRDSYNQNINNVVERKFDGSHLTFPGLYLDFELRQHQKNAVWRSMQEDSVYLGHEVGTGKTLVLGASLIEKKRVGQIRKPVLNVMNGNVEQITNSLRDAYPTAKIFSGNDAFTPEKRKESIAEIAAGNFDLVILTYEQLDKIPLSEKTTRAYVTSEIRQIQMAISNAEEQENNARLVSRLNGRIRSLEKDLEELTEDKKTDNILTFEETGIDYIAVDEFHNFKSLPIYTTMGDVKGIPTSRSDRATKMHMRLGQLREKHGTVRLLAASGTPITNTTAEIYNLMRYTQPEELEARGLQSFDAFARTFTETVTKMEATVTGEYKTKTRLAKYINTPELRALAGKTLDVVSAQEAGIVRPRREEYVISAPLGDDQKEFRAELQARAEEIAEGEVDPKDDNYLSILNDGRLMSVDIRLVGWETKDNPQSKVNYLVENVLRLADEHPGGTQFVFSNIGVSDKNQFGFSVYNDIEKKLVEGGMPQERIANFGRMSDKPRRAAIEKLAAGEVLVVIGSTERLGTGVNAQNFAVAAHTLDVPWLPSAVEQRDGRTLRQGNLIGDLGGSVKMFRYVTEGSFDEIGWTTIDRKTSFIKQIITNDLGGERDREEKNLDDFNAAQIAALASGNPDVLRKLELTEEISALERMRRRERQIQLEVADQLPLLRDEIAGWTRRLEKAKLENNFISEQKQLDDEENNGKFFIRLNDREITSRQEAQKIIDQKLRTANQHTVFGEYRGFNVAVAMKQDIVLRNRMIPSLALESPVTGQSYEVETSADAYDISAGVLPRTLNKIERSLPKIELDVSRKRQNLSSLELQSNKEFKFAENLKDLQTEYREVETRLANWQASERDAPATEKTLEITPISADASAEEAARIKQVLDGRIENPQKIQVAGFVSAAHTAELIRARMLNLEMPSEPVAEKAQPNFYEQSQKEQPQKAVQLSLFGDGDVSPQSSPQISEARINYDALDKDVRKVELIIALAEVDGADLKDLLPMSEIAYEGKGIVKANAPSFEIVKQIINQANSENLLPHSLRQETSGLTISGKYIGVINQKLKDNIDELPAKGFSPELTEKFRTLEQELTKASSQNNAIIIYVDEIDLNHELFHQAVRLGQQNETAEQKLNVLTEHPAYRKAIEGGLEISYKNLDKEALTEELGAFLWNNDYNEIGVERQTGENYLETFLTSFAETNGRESLKYFEERSHEYVEHIVKRVTAKIAENPERENLGELNGRADDSKIREAVSRTEGFAPRGETQTVVEPLETTTSREIVSNTNKDTNGGADDKAQTLDAPEMKIRPVAPIDPIQNSLRGGGDNRSDTGDTASESKVESVTDNLPANRQFVPETEEDREIRLEASRNQAAVMRLKLEKLYAEKSEKKDAKNAPELTFGAGVGTDVLDAETLQRAARRAITQNALDEVFNLKLSELLDKAEINFEAEKSAVRVNAPGMEVIRQFYDGLRYKGILNYGNGEASRGTAMMHTPGISEAMQGEFEKVGSQLQAAGYSAGHQEKFAAFVETYRQASETEKYPVFYIDEQDLDHELFHQASWTGQPNEEIKHRDLRPLIEHPVFQKAWANYVGSAYGGITDQRKVEEVAAFLAGGDKGLLRITQSEQDSYLKAHLVSYGETNGAEKLNLFSERSNENGERVIESAREQIKQSGQFAAEQLWSDTAVQSIAGVLRTNDPITAAGENQLRGISEAPQIRVFGIGDGQAQERAGKLGSESLDNQSLAGVENEQNKVAIEINGVSVTNGDGEEAVFNVFHATQEAVAGEEILFTNTALTLNQKFGGDSISRKYQTAESEAGQTDSNVPQSLRGAKFYEALAVAVETAATSRKLRVDSQRGQIVWVDGDASVIEMTTAQALRERFYNLAGQKVIPLVEKADQLQQSIDEKFRLPLASLKQIFTDRQYEREMDVHEAVISSLSDEREINLEKQKETLLDSVKLGREKAQTGDFKPEQARELWQKGKEFVVEMRSMESYQVIQEIGKRAFGDERHTSYGAGLDITAAEILKRETCYAKTLEEDHDLKGKHTRFFVSGESGELLSRDEFFTDRKAGEKEKDVQKHGWSITDVAQASEHIGAERKMLESVANQQRADLVQAQDNSKKTGINVLMPSPGIANLPKNLSDFEERLKFSLNPIAHLEAHPLVQLHRAYKAELNAWERLKVTENKLEKAVVKSDLLRNTLQPAVRSEYEIERTRIAQDTSYLRDFTNTVKSEAVSGERVLQEKGSPVKPIWKPDELELAGEYASAVGSVEGLTSYFRDQINLHNARQDFARSFGEIHAKDALKNHEVLVDNKMIEHLFEKHQKPAALEQKEMLKKEIAGHMTELSAEMEIARASGEMDKFWQKNKMESGLRGEAVNEQNIFARMLGKRDIVAAKLNELKNWHASEFKFEKKNIPNSKEQEIDLGKAFVEPLRITRKVDRELLSNEQVDYVKVKDLLVKRSEGLDVSKQFDLAQTEMTRLRDLSNLSINRFNSAERAMDSMITDSMNLQMSSTLRGAPERKLLTGGEISRSADILSKSPLSPNGNGSFKPETGMSEIISKLNKMDTGEAIQKHSAVVEKEVVKKATELKQTEIIALEKRVITRNVAAETTGLKKIIGMAMK